ncbi:MAG: hypothetical protein ACP5R5_10905 [Armatimonadota bacterium]
MIVPHRLVLALILGVFAVLAAGHSLATRLRYAPDEPAHYIYIRSLAISHAPPPISHKNTPTQESESTHEGHQPPLYYALMAVFFALLRSVGAADDLIWRVLRLLDIPVGLFWIGSVYALTREYFEREGYALAATAFVALIPTSSYMAGVINNEMLISLLFTRAMLPILRYFKTGTITVRSAAFLGLLIGLAALTKAQGLILVPMFALAAFAVCRRNRYANSRQVLRDALVVLGPALVVSGWWFARCWLVYGTPMPHSLNDPVLQSGWLDFVMVPGSCLVFVVISTLAVYGYFWVPFWIIWPFVSSILPLVAVMVAMTLVVAVGAALRVRRGGDLDSRSLAFLLVAPALVYAAWLRYVLFVDRWANLQGRLFLSVAAVVGIVWILGFDGLFRTARAKRTALAVGLATMLVANAAVMLCAVKLYSS